MRNKLLQLFALLVLSLPLAAGETAELFRIHQVSPEQLQMLTRARLDIDHVRKGEVDIWLTEAELRKVTAWGMTPQPIPNQAAQMFAWLQEHSSRDNPLRSYHDYGELTTRLQTLADEHPDLCRLYSAGQSVQGRELWVLKITDNPDQEEDEPEVKYVSTMHGDEPVGTEMLLNLAELLLTQYGSDPQISQLVDELEIHLLPLMNPDGNALGQRYNAHNVDLNRHFPDPYTDPVNSPEGREPEIQAVMNWTAAHSFVLSANFHTGALVVNYPYDNNEDGASVYTAAPDDQLFIQMSESYSVHNTPMWNGDFPHGITNGADWYAISGGMQDWNYVWMGDMEVTIELNNVKWHDESQLPALWDDNREALLSYLENALTGIRGIITDAVSGAPLGATVQLEGVDSYTYADPQVGDYHRICRAGTYTLLVSCEGYEPASVPGINVTDGGAVVVNVALNPLPTALVYGVVTDQDGTPLSGAEVTALATGFPAAVTGGDGNYTLELPDQANYQIRVVYPGMAAQTVSLYLDGDTQRNFQLQPAVIEDFESGGFASFPWEQGGDQPWIVTGTDPQEGSFCAQSGNIGDDQTTELTLAVDVETAGEVSFYYRVSSESGYDFLRFFMDGTEQGAWSGEIPWTETAVAVTAGHHIFAWKYVKDGSVSQGSDCAWLDYIRFPLLGTPGYPEIAVTPAAFSVTLPPGASTTEYLTIANSGDAVLDYSLNITEDPVRMFTAQHPVIRVPKGGAEPVGVGDSRNAGEPDAYGYVWRDSDEPGGPLFQWEEINGSGTTLPAADDGNTGPYDLGFTFNFYGVDYTTVRVCTNGFLSFTSASDAYTNQHIPQSGEPNALLAPFWDDLNPSAGGAVYMMQLESPRRFIVEWEAVPHYNNSGSPETFQVILYPDGRFLYQYQQLGDPTSCTVGCENAEGTDGQEVVYNSAYLHNGLALEFLPPRHWLSADPTAGDVAPGGSTQIELLIDAGELPKGIYDGIVTIFSNDPEAGELAVPVTLTVSLTPDPVTDLSIVRQGTEVLLQWSDVAGAVAYRVYVSGEAYTGYQLLAETTATEFTDENTNGYEKRFYRVTAVR